MPTRKQGDGNSTKPAAFSPGSLRDGGRFGDLTPLLAPRSVAIVGASDRRENLGGVCVGFLKKFGYSGAIWPVNPGRPTVGDLPCFPTLRDLPSVPDLVIIAVAAQSVTGVAEECIDVGVPAALAWAGGFEESGAQGRARQLLLRDVCREGGLRFCGPNCIGVINTSIGLTASFGSMMNELDRLEPGCISIVSQSGGIATMAHARAQQAGFGFRVTVSCGNEAVLSIGDFIRALARDDGTRVIAVYTEGVSDAPAFVEALTEAHERGKPVVILKGGASPAARKAAAAHTGRLAGVDRTYDAIFREFAVIRVHSMEELLDVCLLLATLEPTHLPRGGRIVMTTFGGGSGVTAADQCTRAGLTVADLASGTRRRVAPLLPPICSVANPVDLTPQAINDDHWRSRLPDALKVLADDPNIDTLLFLAGGMSQHSERIVDLFAQLRAHSSKPVCLSWLFAPEPVVSRLAASGIVAFSEHARAIRAIGHLAWRAENLSHRVTRVTNDAPPFPWTDFVPGHASRTFTEDLVARILEAADLPVARGRLASTAEDAVLAAEEVGFPVAIKGISPALTHRATAGFVALDLATADAVAEADRDLRERAAALGLALDGLWVQHMIRGATELLVTAFRDRDFGVMVGCGMGGNLTEIIDDVIFARAPVDARGAYDLIGCLRTLRRLPETIPADRRRRAADFIARFSALAVTAPWENFTLEINPLKLGQDERSVGAVDGLLIVESANQATDDASRSSANRGYIA